MITEAEIKARTVIMPKGIIQPSPDGVGWLLMPSGRITTQHTTRTEALEAYHEVVGDDGTSCLNCGS